MIFQKKPQITESSFVNLHRGDVCPHGLNRLKSYLSFVLLIQFGLFGAQEVFDLLIGQFLPIRSQPRLINISFSSQSFSIRFDPFFLLFNLFLFFFSEIFSRFFDFLCLVTIDIKYMNIRIFLCSNLKMFMLCIYKDFYLIYVRAIQSGRETKIISSAQ